MKSNRTLRYIVIAAILFLGTIWSLSMASDGGRTAGYPNHEFLVSAKWLKEHIKDNRVLIVDVRDDNNVVRFCLC